jgi:hypothetical protein
VERKHPRAERCGLAQSGNAIRLLCSRDFACTLFGFQRRARGAGRDIAPIERLSAGEVDDVKMKMYRFAHRPIHAVRRGTGSARKAESLRLSNAAWGTEQREEARPLGAASLTGGDGRHGGCGCGGGDWSARRAGSTGPLAWGTERARSEGHMEKWRRRMGNSVCGQGLTMTNDVLGHLIAKCIVK